MKVILTAFQGKLRSEPMDWPEATPEWADVELPLTKPFEASLEPRKGVDIKAFKTIVRGRFRRTGWGEVLPDGRSCFIYELVELR